MGCYISETEAKTTLEGIVSQRTDNFFIYTRKRVTSTPIRKKVTFAIVLVYNEVLNEQVYDDFLKFDVDQNKETKILQSETFLENSKKKEVLFVECLIEVY